MQVWTLPVYSKVAADADVQRLGLSKRCPIDDDGRPWRLSEHQVATYEALVEGRSQVVYNTALTGDGKSLAGQLPALLHGGDTHALVAMCPTNELNRDQEKQLKRTQEQWGSSLYPGMLNSAVLDEIMAEGSYSRRGDALTEILSTCDVLLTNPDIFHLITHQFYVQLGPHGDAPDRIFGPMMQRFTQFTFDEFHIFDTPQVVSVLNAMLLFRETEGLSRPHKFLFLSATPNCLMAEYLRRSGLDVIFIDGAYQHTDTAPQPEGWRRILNGATLHIEAKTAESWVETNLESTLLSFFETRRPHAKGAIIVNSVASAHRLLAKIGPVFAARGLTVMPNTGLTSQADRKASYDADLLIGTSTVDVGVDFQINFLLFESRDAGSFVQRLGRLGRHNSYTRDGQTYEFHDFEAYALVPPWIKESLEQGRDGAPALLPDGETVDRESLHNAINEAYPRTARFDRYIQHWGKLQTVHILRGLANATIREQYAEARAALGERYVKTYHISLRHAIGDYREIFKEQRPLWEEAISFRGGSYFACNIIDESKPNCREPKTADVFQMVANGILAETSEEEFYEAVMRAGLSRKPFEGRKPLTCFRLKGWAEERREFILRLDHDIRYWSGERFDQAGVVKGWHLEATVPGLARLNRALCQRKLPALLCRGVHPLDLKRRMRLPLLFAVHSFISRDGIEGSVAFGREALLLDTQLRYRGISIAADSTIL